MHDADPGLTLLLGGARSGKSTFALDLAQQHGGAVSFLATSPRIAGDDDLARRIARHRAERPATWRTIEEDRDLAGALESVDTPVVVVDCLTVWLGNLLHHGSDDASVEQASTAAIESIGRNRLTALAVSNEVGLGIVPDNPLARRYRDLLGRVNQAWARAARQVLLMVAGRAVRLGDPREIGL